MYLLNWSWVIIARAWIFSGAIAQESDDCSDVPYGSQINVSQPSDMEQFANCTTLVGDMVIQGGYQRAILLPNMAHMDGAIRESHNGPRPRADNVSMPSLKTVKQAIEIGGDGLVAVDLSSLVEVRGLNIMWAKLESLNLNRLQNVSNELYISHCADCDSTTENGIELPLDQLKVRQVSEYPRSGVEILGPPPDPDYYSLGPGDDHNYGSGIYVDVTVAPEPVRPDFPSLSQVDQKFEVSGNIEFFSTPKLHETRADIRITGEVGSSRLRKLRSFNTILVNSHWNFDGDAFTAEREENSGYLEDGSSVNYNSVKISGISKIAKILIGISVLLGVAILISVAIYIRQKRCEALKEMKENELVEMRRPTSPARESEPSLTTAPVDIVPDGSPPPYTPNEK